MRYVSLLQVITLKKSLTIAIIISYSHSKGIREISYDELGMPSLV